MCYFVDIHTHIATDSDIAIVNRKFNQLLEPNIIYSVGLHPWQLSEPFAKSLLTDLEMQISSSINIVAIGECGIDRAIDTSVDIQKKYFSEQIQLSEKFCLPLIIHCVKAYSDMLAVLKEHNPVQPWIFHGFHANGIIANQIVEKGCYLSFGKLLLSNRKNQELYIQTPLENVFFETDDSGEKIENVYKKAADLRHICINELKKQVYLNFKRVFKLNE